MNKGAPKFSIIIPTREVNHFIREAIPHHLNQDYKDFEIIIVTEVDEKEIFEKTRYIKVGKVPPSEKRNLGVRESRGEIIAFIDDDAYPEKKWLENADKTFEDESIVGIGGPGILPEKSTFFQKVSNKVYALSSRFTGIRYEKGKKREINDWPTCNFLVRKKDFLKAGGFNSKYWGGEDTQVCYSLIKSGKRIVYDPEVIVHHHTRKTLRNHLKQTLFWGMWRGFFMRLYPKNSIKPIFFMPALFVLGLLFGGVLSIISKTIRSIYLAILGLYLIFLVITGIRTKSIKLFLPVIIVTFLTQVTYGIGLLKGVILGEPTRRTFNPAEKKILSTESKR
ncbi:hypothetical protein COU61_00225 [Candidatus Pacearchaeota archaeon CG10_big_fil_rev_8_21_14_0_10_35_13]|nr:MAG: hypothetical protein COU61_00225 [Candidatus Pacearchaeota archaeon CG10_big_fil_rev_8_21_14_0_10_35_13]